MTKNSPAVHVNVGILCCTAGAEMIPQKPKYKMKIKLIIGGMLSAALLAASVSGCASEKQAQARLQSQAKVSREQARQTALAQVPGGTVKEGDIEKEKGKLIWSFDIATPDSKNITEVQVDAVTGAVLAVDKETPEDQAKEAAADATKAKPDEDKD